MHWLKVPFPIVVTEGGTTISFNEEHFPKALFDNEITEEGIITSSRDAHP